LIILPIRCLIIVNACAQTVSPDKLPATDFFVGSTPCDAFIKSILKIQADVTCEFIKWELSLYKNKNEDNSGTFELNALYGASQPNTNGFINGGKRIAAKGRYSISYGMRGNSKTKVYHLSEKSFQSSILLAEMDDNILHFIDSEKKFIVGNGGWGYVLNRIKQ